MKTLNAMLVEGPPLAMDGRASGAAKTTAEQLITVKAAADALGLPTWKLGRAAKQGVFPSYSLLNTRRLVKLSEVVAAIEASRQGGAL